MNTDERPRRVPHPLRTLADTGVERSDPEPWGQLRVTSNPVGDRTFRLTINRPVESATTQRRASLLNQAPIPVFVLAGLTLVVGFNVPERLPWVIVAVAIAAAGFVLLVRRDARLDTEQFAYRTLDTHTIGDATAFWQAAERLDAMNTMTPYSPEYMQAWADVYTAASQQPRLP